MAERRNHETNVPRYFESERTLKDLHLFKPLRVPEGTTVLDVCTRMAAADVDVVLVTNTNHVNVGMLTHKDITTRVIAEGLRPDQTLISKFVISGETYVGTSATTAIEALQLMAIGNFRHLPVVVKNSTKLIGLLDISSCLCDAISRMRKVSKQGSVIAAAIEGVGRRYGNNFPELSTLMGTLREHMFTASLSTVFLEPSRVATVSPSDTVYVAAKKMRDSWVNCVLIMTGNNIQGILTSKDILMRVVAHNLCPELTLVEKVMTPNPKYTTLDTTILEALCIMHDGKFLHLPVVDKDGNVAACLDVLRISYGAIAELGYITAASTDAAFTVMQMILDSKLILKPADDSDTQSEINMSQYVPSDGTNHLKPSYLVGNSFSFKLMDHKGRVHKFNWGTYNLAELVSDVMQRVGVSDDKKECCRLLCEDDEGDKVVLTMDGDLVAAVAQAKYAGEKVLRIHLHYDSIEETRIDSSQETNTKELHFTLLYVVALLLVLFDISLRLGWTKA